MVFAAGLPIDPPTASSCSGIEIRSTCGVPVSVRSAVSLAQPAPTSVWSTSTSNALASTVTTLAIARIDADALTLELREHPVAPVVSSSLRGIAAEARLRHVRLASEVDGSVVEVLVENGEPVEYGQVLFRVDPA